MKKLLILVLVLSIASAASATLSLSFEGADVDEATVSPAPSAIFFIDVHQDVAQPDGFWIGITGPASYMGYGTLIQPPATSTLALSDGGYGHGWIAAQMDVPAVDGEIGEWWVLEMHCEGEGDVIIDLYDAGGNTIIDTLIVHQVPEPMTIALLGLGGLLLRRRKA